MDSDLQIKIIRRKDIVPTIWGGGKTYQYYIFPEDAKYEDKNFDFRFSSATIENSPSVFTKFSGYQRFLTMLDGTLSIERNGKSENFSNLELFTFDSEDLINSFSIGVDFNLMIKKGYAAVNHSLLKEINLSEFSILFLFATDTCKIEVNCQIFDLERFDALIIKNPSNIKAQIFATKSIIVNYW